jgi:SAM-dependent methyltransferase
MGASLPFALPAPGQTSEAPVWTGAEFVVGDMRCRVLCFPIGVSGWSDDLTAFHDDTAGADHFIDVASRRHTLGALARCVSGRAPVVLEIGCSSGHFLRLLQAEMPEAIVVGADYVRAPLEQIAESVASVPLLQFDLTQCPLPANTFDAVVLLNVLEHIERDDLAMAHVARILKPGGVAMIEVPAGPGLYDAYDALLHHHRRYTMRGLTALARGARLDIVARSHLGFLMYPAFWVAKKISRLRGAAPPAAQEQQVAASILATRRANPLGNAIMAAEAGLRHLAYLPVGIRCLLTCRKP